MEDAGVVHEDVEAAEGLGRLVDRGPGLGRRRPGRPPPRRAAEGGGRRLDLLGPQVDEGHRRRLRPRSARRCRSRCRGPPPVITARRPARRPVTAPPPGRGGRPTRAPAAVAMASRTVVARGTASSSAGEPGATATGRQPEAARLAAGDGGVGLDRAEVGGHHQQGARLQRIGPPDEVERVLQVVGAGRHRHAGVEQRTDGGQAARRRRGPAPRLEEQVGLGERDDGDPGRRHRRRHLGLHRGRLHPEAAAVAGRDPVREAVAPWWPARPGGARRRRASRPCAGPRPGPSASATSSTWAMAARGSGSRCGHPPTMSAPAAIAARQRRPVRTAVGAADRRADEGHDLEVDQVADRLAGLHERLDAERADVGGDVDVGAHRRHAVGDQHPHRLLGPPGDVLEGERRPVGPPRHDGAEEVAGRVRHPIGRQRLVEVGVGLGGGGQQHVPRQIDARSHRRRGVQPGRHGGDQLALDADVGPRPIGQRGPLQQHQGVRRQGPDGHRSPRAGGRPPRPRGATARRSRPGSGRAGRRRCRGAPARRDPGRTRWCRPRRRPSRWP